MSKDTVQNILMGAGAFFLVSKAAKAVAATAANAFEYEIAGVQPNWSNAQNGYVTLAVTFKVTNNNPVSVRLSDIRGEVHYGDVLVANISQPLAVQLTPGVQKFFTLNINIAAVQLVSDIIESISDLGAISTLLNTLHFEGVIYTDTVNIPISQNLRVA